jgi:predicted RNA binding protein YcfA (HicA-like mRNA interferase family)
VVAWTKAGLDRTPYRVVGNPARVYLGRRKRWRKSDMLVYCGGRMTGQFVLRQIREAGCKPGPVRQQGSHVRVECEAGRCRTTVPVHRSQDLPAGTLRAIERDLEPCLGRRWLQG